MKTMLTAAAAALALPTVLVGAVAGGLARPVAVPSEPPDLGDVPPAMAALYAQAAARHDVPAALLAAVGKVECDHNRNPACAVPNSAGAAGPMQFLPTTFTRWQHASGRPNPSILDPGDAVHAAAAKLAADGAATNPEQALLAYNPSRTYVAVVTGWALAYGWRPPDAAVVTRSALAHPRLALRPAARHDVEAGRVDPRVLAALLVLATRHDLRYVGPFVTGHTYYVAGTTRPSNHAFGRAVDIPWIDDAPVTPHSTATRRAAQTLLELPEWLRPDELGCPWPLDGGRTRIVVRNHDDHLHYGLRA